MIDRSFVSLSDVPDAQTSQPVPRPSLPSPAVVLPAADAASLIVALGLAGRGSWLAVAYVILSYLALMVTGSHRVRVNTTVGLDLPWLLARLAIPFMLVAGLAVALEAPAASIARLVAVASAAVVVLTVGRAVADAAIRAARRRGRLLGRVVIVGAGEVGAELAKVLQEHPEYGLAPAGFVDTAGHGHHGVPMLGGPGSLPILFEKEQVTDVIIAFGAMSEQRLAQTLRECESAPVEVYVVPRLFEFGIAPAGMLADEVWGIPLIRLRRPALRPAARVLKRAFDVAAASVALLLAVPVLLAAALAVRRSSPGPVLFRQLRMGQHGRPFELLKFRTMTVNGDSDTTWSVDGDARVTRVGRLLRRTCVDELPQLLNVLSGQMSLVGPRPERPHFARHFAVRVPNYDDRHRAPAGMTGWAQVHGLRGDTPIPDRVRFDNYYIEHWSLWLDLVIMARTAFGIITGRC